MVDIACLSFFPTKVLGCYGDGGALLTNKKNVSKKIKSLTLHGRGNHKYDNKFVCYFCYNATNNFAFFYFNF